MSKLRRIASDALSPKLKNRLRNAVHPAQRLAMTRLVGGRRSPDLGLLSVVIPVFNVEAYVSECLASVAGQSYTNLEIIVVDDGSTDESMSLVGEFAKWDKRIKVIRLEHGGNGRARNIGVAAATGAYLTFADSDDIVAPGAYELMMSTITKTRSDFVVGSSDRLIGKKRQPTKLSSRMHAESRLGIAIDDFPDILDDVFLWNKLFQKSFWDKSVSPIPEGVLYEDQETTARAFIRADAFDVLTAIVYSWRQRGDGTSITQGKRSQKDLEDRLAVAHRVTSLVKEEAGLQILEKWYVRLVGKDLMPYYEQVPYTPEQYWTSLQLGVSSLARVLSRSVEHMDGLVRQIDPHARVLLRLTTNCLKTELVKVLVDRMENGTGFEVMVSEGNFMAIPNYYPTIQQHMTGLTLECAPTVMELASSIAVRGRSVDGGLQLAGHAFLPGLSDGAGQTDVSLAVHVGSSDWQELLVKSSYDDHLDANVSDSFAWHGRSAFLAKLPAELVPNESNVVVQFRLSLKVNGHEYVDLHAVTVPGELLPTRAADHRPVVSAFVVDINREEFAVDVAWGQHGPCTNTYLATAQYRLKPTKLLDLDDNVTRFTFSLAQEIWGRPVKAPPSGAYTLRYEPTAKGTTLGLGLPLSASRDIRGELPSHSELRHSNIMAWLTGQESFAVTIGPPLDLSERGRHRQRELQQIFSFVKKVDIKHGVLFESFGGKVCTDSPRALSDALHREFPNMKIFWSVVDYSVNYPEYAQAVIRGSRLWYEAITSAQVVVNNQDFPHYFRKNPHQHYLQTWHGTPLKKIGIDVPLHTVSPLYRESVHREAATWDGLLVQNDFSAAVIPRSLGHNGEIINVGYPRNDLLTSVKAMDIRAKTREILGVEDSDLIVLYAPTWRDSSKDGGNNLLPVTFLDIDMVINSLPTGTKMLIRSHHNIVIKSANYSHDYAVDVSDYPEINDLLLASDVLITDYSSIMFDYSVMRKPIVYFAPDLDEYREVTRGFYLDYEDIAGPALCMSSEEVLRLLRVVVEDDDASIRLNDLVVSVSRTQREYANMDDGQASLRTIHSLIKTGALTTPETGH